MKKTVRASIKFLTEKMGMDSATALAYLSGATDFERIFFVKTGFKCAEGCPTDGFMQLGSQ
jgi:hypothetical protein